MMLMNNHERMIGFDEFMTWKSEWTVSGLATELIQLNELLNELQNELLN